jgi:hypothetical protein
VLGIAMNANLRPSRGAIGPIVIVENFVFYTQQREGAVDSVMLAVRPVGVNAPVLRCATPTFFLPSERYCATHGVCDTHN